MSSVVSLARHVGGRLDDSLLWSRDTRLPISVSSQNSDKRKKPPADWKGRPKGGHPRRTVNSGLDSAWDGRGHLSRVMMTSDDAGWHIGPPHTMTGASPPARHGTARYSGRCLTMRQSDRSVPLSLSVRHVWQTDWPAWAGASLAGGLCVGHTHTCTQPVNPTHYLSSAYTAPVHNVQ